MRSELAYASPSRVGVRQPVRDAGGPVPPGAGEAPVPPGAGEAKSDPIPSASPVGFL